MGSKHSFPRTFWTANIVELFERWAWYGMFAVFAIYLTDSTDTGALGFSQSQKGYLMGPLVAFLYLLPVVTGAIADKFGYKKVLLVAFGMLSMGYFLMPLVNSYAGVYLVFMFIALGAALFKPVISATIARTTHEGNSSIGFGIFYMMVNIGAFIGPIFASKLRGVSWSYVFYMSAGIALLNFVLVLFFYREPSRIQSDEKLAKAIGTIWKSMVKVILDFRFLLFLLIIVGFWAMYYQFFYSLPVFISQWVDTSALYSSINNFSPALAEMIGTPEKNIAPEMLTNIDALYIVLFQIFVSTLVMRLRPLSAMTSGIFVSAIGVGLMFMFDNPYYLLVSILIFGLGEMASSPKITEYIGRIAPGDKVALYIGTSYLPVAGGNLLAGYLSGDVYTRFSDKISLLRLEMVSRGVNLPEISDKFTQNQFLSESANLLKMNQAELTQFLWDKYHPSSIWYVFTGIGFLTAILLVLYNRFVLKKV